VWLDEEDGREEALDGEDAGSDGRIGGKRGGGKDPGGYALAVVVGETDIDVLGRLSVVFLCTKRSEVAAFEGKEIGRK
jgi:hypothetical protein